MALRRVLLNLRPAAFTSGWAGMAYGTAAAPTGPISVASQMCVLYPTVLGDRFFFFFLLLFASYLLPPSSREKSVSHARPSAPCLSPPPSPSPSFFCSRRIDITVVIEGIRYKVKGKVGKTLAQVLAESNIPELAETCECKPKQPLSIRIASPLTNQP